MPSSTSSSPAATVLALHQVSVAFHTTGAIRHVLHDIDLRLNAGQFIAIVGQNGSGKSTLARVLAQICPVSKGRVEGSSASIQMVFQNPEAQIVGETVYEDIQFGLENRGVARAQVRQRAENAMRMAGLEVELDRPVTQLSGGQKQRLCIASAVAADAQAFVFDEPTSMLDELGRKQILAAAQRLRQQGAGIVWITQRMDELVHADEVLALQDGRVVFRGSPRAFFYDDSPCAALGFEPPYVVRLAQALETSGVVAGSAGSAPLHASELAAEVARQCR